MQYLSNYNFCVATIFSTFHLIECLYRPRMRLGCYGEKDPCGNPAPTIIEHGCMIARKIHSVTDSI